METELGGGTAVWIFQRDDRAKAALMLPGARYVHHGEVTKFSRVRAARTIGHASAPKFGAEKSAYRSGGMYIEKPWEFKEWVTSSSPPAYENRTLDFRIAAKFEPSPTRCGRD